MITVPLAEQAALSALLTQPHRHYHNITHVYDLLAELEMYRKDTQCLETDTHGAEWAVWYHDACYNPYSKDNEAQSAKLFDEMHCKDSFVERSMQEASAAILATAKHTETLGVGALWELSLTEKLMLDVDLSGMGKPSHIFFRNSWNIRKEYYNSTDREIVEGRLKFFKALDQRPTFYYTDYFRDKYHQRAKENVEQEIYLLERALRSEVPEAYMQLVQEQALVV